jgi:hypothetical protein
MATILRKLSTCAIYIPTAIRNATNQTTCFKELHDLIKPSRWLWARPAFAKAPIFGTARRGEWLSNFVGVRTRGVRLMTRFLRSESLLSNSSVEWWRITVGTTVEIVLQQFTGMPRCHVTTALPDGRARVII